FKLRNLEYRRYWSSASQIFEFVRVWYMYKTLTLTYLTKALYCILITTAQTHQVA
ncbi:unnamed protein product, partial [Rotaria sp. Silwood1]